MTNSEFSYNGQKFRPYRKMTASERQQPLSALEGKLTRYSDEEFSRKWDMDEFFKHSACDLFWWKGKVVMPGFDTFYVLNGFGL